MSNALQFLVLMLPGWLQRRLRLQIEYLIAENTVYKRRFHRMAHVSPMESVANSLSKPKPSAARSLRVATIATPETILRSYRRLVAQKYDNEPLVVRAAQVEPHGTVCRRQRLGGLLNYYARAAA